jgi:hypothetical protein
VTEQAPSPQDQPSRTQPRDATSWAVSSNVLHVTEVPAEAVNLNVEGRRLTGALQGFGQLWQKTYKVRLTSAGVTPKEVVRVWKEEFPSFVPPHSRFYPALSGVAPGQVMLINASLQGLPVYTGVMILYADEESFTVMTDEGHPEAGWNTFSAYQDEDGTTVAQIQSLARSSDPIYELSFRLFASSQQEKIWTHVLTSLAPRFGVSGRVQMQKVLVDPKLQWRRVGNVWHNAGARSMLYTTAAPLRWGLSWLRR